MRWGWVGGATVHLRAPGIRRTAHRDMVAVDPRGMPYRVSLPPGVVRAVSEVSRCNLPRRDVSVNSLSRPGQGTTYVEI